MEGTNMTMGPQKAIFSCDLQEHDRFPYDQKVNRSSDLCGHNRRRKRPRLVADPINLFVTYYLIPARHGGHERVVHTRKALRSAQDVGKIREWKAQIAARKLPNLRDDSTVNLPRCCEGALESKELGR
jgi:hypothetical protein